MFSMLFRLLMWPLLSLQNEFLTAKKRREKNLYPYFVKIVRFQRELVPQN